MYLFSHPVFPECWLCARLCLSHWKYKGKENRNCSSLLELPVYWQVGSGSLSRIAMRKNAWKENAGCREPAQQRISAEHEFRKSTKAVPSAKTPLGRQWQVVEAWWQRGREETKQRQEDEQRCWDSKYLDIFKTHRGLKWENKRRELIVISRLRATNDIWSCNSLGVDAEDFDLCYRALGNYLEALSRWASTVWLQRKEGSGKAELYRDLLGDFVSNPREESCWLWLGMRQWRETW